MSQLERLQKAIFLRQAMLQGQGVVGGRMKGGLGTKAGARKNPWLAHVRAFRTKHPNLSYAEALKRARASYVPGAKRKPKPRARKAAPKRKVGRPKTHRAERAALRKRRRTRQAEMFSY